MPVRSYAIAVADWSSRTTLSVVVARFVSLWVVVTSVFTATWILSYSLLPHGLLRGGNPGAIPGDAGSTTREFLWLFARNVGVSLIAVGTNTLQSVIHRWMTV